MHRRAKSVLALLPSLLIVAACSASRPSPPLPEQNARLVYPALPPTLCARKPVPPAIDADDREWAMFKRADSDAGDDCRDKLDEVHRVRSAWPVK